MSGHALLEYGAARLHALERHALALRLRLRCLRFTNGLHQLDIAEQRCHYCRRSWTEFESTEPGLRHT